MFALRLAALACFVSLLLLPGAKAAAEPVLHLRGGLPHLAARAHATAGELRVAYLGGSITAAADGWRSLTTAHLQRLFPQLTVTEIAAGLPGTGSDVGVCRLDYHVLRHRPDLIFVEFAVNDTNAPPERIERTMEGIVRQAKTANPAVELCFVYTVSTPGVPDLQAGIFPPSARAMETVAAHYGIPSIHFGVEVARRVAAGEVIFKQTAPPASMPAFSLDGVHPTADGHRIYFEVLARSLPKLMEPAAEAPGAPPAPLHSDHWGNAGLWLFERFTATGDWAAVPTDDASLRGSIPALLPPTWRATQPGAAVEFEFTGEKFGLLGISAPDGGEFRVTVDDGAPVTATFFDSYTSPTFCRMREWFYPGALPRARHRVRVELLATTLDKAAIKQKGGRPIVGDTQPYRPHHLTLCGALVVGAGAP